MSSVVAVLGRKILFQFKRKEFYIPSEKVAWRAGSFGAHVFPVEACSGASETRGNEWAQDTRRHSFNDRKILMPFQLTQPVPSTRQITQRLLYF
jgi:hypothetical protein